MTFAWPLALLGLALVPILIGVYLAMQRRRQRYVVRFTNLALLREVVKQAPGARRHVPAGLFLLGLAALLVSLARPSMVLAVPRDEASVMLVLDVSGSMNASDLQPTRLGAAKQAAESLIARLPKGAQVGVVSFSQTASLNAPLSNDPPRPCGRWTGSARAAARPSATASAWPSISLPNGRPTPRASAPRPWSCCSPTARTTAADRRPPWPCAPSRRA